MNRSTAILFLALVTLLAGCVGGSGVQRRYYSISYNLNQDLRVYQNHRYPVTLRVERFQSSQAYDRNELVYRTNAHEFQYDYFRLWAAKPRKMMREVVAGHLKHANLFENVVINIGDRIPEYELRGEILAIEELDASADVWFAHLAMRFTLVRFEDGKRIWEYDFDERRQVYNRMPVHVVRTLSEILEDEMVTVTQKLDTYFANATGAPLPEGGYITQGKSTSDTSGDNTSEGGPDGPDDGTLDTTQPGAVLKKKENQKE